MPNGLKVFLWSLLSGSAMGVLAFRLILYFGTQWAGEDEMRMVTVMILSVLGSLAIGVASAVTAGVTVGKRLRP